MSCITSRLLIVLSGGCQLSLATFRGQGRSPAQLHGGLLDLAEADTDLGVLNARGHKGGHYRVRLPRRTETVNVVAPLDHMKAPSDEEDESQSQFGQRQGRVRQFKRQNNFNPNSFALARQNQVPTFLGGQNFGNRPQRPGRPQGQRPSNLFVNNNQGFQRPSGGFRPQQQGQFRPQQQQGQFRPQQQQQQSQIRQQQRPQSQGFIQEPQTTVQQTSSPSTPAPVVRVSVSDISSSAPASPVSASTSASTRAPSPTFSSSPVTSSLAPSTRQPRVLPVNNNNNFGSSSSSFGSTSGNTFGSSSSNFGSSSGSFGSSSGNPFGQEPRGGRAGHGGDHGGNGYTAPAAPEPEYHPPAADYGHKPSYKILKLTGLDTAPLPNFNYMYATENKINVMAEGELRNVCGEDVSVMRGSYDYYGPDGVKYTVDWYADETGFHPSAAHLPQPVEPNHPEVAAAVAAQLAAAADHHYKRYKRDTGYSAPPPCPPPEPTYEPAPLPSYTL